MDRYERLTGEAAQEVIEGLREKELVLQVEGGEGYYGEDDESFYVFYPGFAFELPEEDEDLAVSALRFPDRASRDSYMRDKAGGILEAVGRLSGHSGSLDGSKLGVGGQILDASGSWLKELAASGVFCADLKESDFQVALFERMGEASGVRRELGIQRKGGRPGAIPGWDPGAVDLVAESDDGPVWIELKWAKSFGTLFNCLWDAAKLAGAVRSGAACAGYLAAGAPVVEWEKDHPYRDLFTFHSWEDGSIATGRHGKSWQGWLDENPATFPTELVDPIQILPTGYVRGGSDDWEVRVVRVTAPGSESVQLSELGF